jgi:hypothetical protein
MRIKNIILIICLTVLSSLTFASSKDITDKADIPDGLKDCRFYMVFVSKPLIDTVLHVVRCDNNDIVSTQTSGKSPINTSLVYNPSKETEIINLDGKEYVNKNDFIKNTKSINVNGVDYFEVK